MYVLYSRAVYIQDRVMMARVRYFDFDQRFAKFRYCEKATNFEKSLTLFLKLFSNVKRKGWFFKILLPSQNI